ncbi:MAG: Uma2 family endonuclease [Planctomycetaceae bacterium]
MATLDSLAPTYLGPNCNGLIMTPEEFDAVVDCDRDYRYELVHGVLVVNAAPGIGETKPNDVLGYWLYLYRDTHSSGGALDDTAPEHYISTSTGRRRPDRVIWAGLGRQPEYDHDVPTIVIEFVSDSSRDRRRDHIEKRREYAEIGVEEYWVIDRFRRQMTVYTKAEPAVLSEFDTCRSTRLPGFELSLPALFSVIDQCTN